MKNVRSFIVLFLLLFAGRSGAQHSTADSLLVFNWIDKAEQFYSNGTYDSALFYCDKADNFSRLKNFKTGQAYALIEKADVLMEMDELDKMAVTGEAVNKLGTQLKDSLVTAIGWMQMAQAGMYKGQFDEAIALFAQSLQYYLAKHPSKYAALAFNDLGYTWGRKGELSKQANCLVQSISIYENYFPEKYGEIGVGYSNLSTVYYQLNDRPRAIEYAKKSLVYREKDGDVERLSIGCCNISQFYAGIDNAEAEKYLNLCVKYALQSRQEQRIIHSYVTASNLYNANKQPALSLEYELKAIELLEKNKKDPAMLARRYMAVAGINRQLGNDTTTINAYYSKSQELLKNLNDKINLRDFYLQLSNYYSEEKNYPAAYSYYKKYIGYRDSIISDKTKSQIEEIATRFETEKKDNEIARLHTTQRIKQLEIGKQKAVIAGNEAIARQKQNEIDLLSQSQELRDVKIRQQQEELEKQVLLAKNNAQQLLLTEKENQLQERQLRNGKMVRTLLIIGIGLTVLLGLLYFNRYQLKKKLEQQNNLLAMRNHISQDLHDDIGASLSSINILNELAKRNVHNPEKATGYLNKSGEDIQRISESMSDIVWNINPKYDDLQHLYIRMRRYAADMLDGMNISYEMVFPEKEEKISLSMEKRRDLYLVFKEAVNNLVKYSQAGNAWIKLAVVPGQVILVVKDNGKGFDRKEIRTGNGLENMEQRAKASGAELEVISGPGEGTTVQLTMQIG